MLASGTLSTVDPNLNAFSKLIPPTGGLSARVPLSPAKLRVEGKTLLVYELHLANIVNVPIKVVSVGISAGKIEIARLEAADLMKQMAPLAENETHGENRLEVPAHKSSVVYIEIEIDPLRNINTLLHDIQFIASGTLTSVSIVISLGNVGVSLGAPLAGGPWIAIHSPVWPRGHRRVIYAVDGVPRIPGRYAIDFVRVDARGRTVVPGSDRMNDVFGYGAPVLAVADATVASMRDDISEASSLSAKVNHAQADSTGNYVSLRLDDGRVVFYEHLKPGSVTVKKGERVKLGQIVGQIGSTGDSTGPHLHFSVASHDSALGAEGLAFTFDRFELLGQYLDLTKLEVTPWQPKPKSIETPRRNEWPNWNTVVQFPGEHLIKTS